MNLLQLIIAGISATVTCVGIIAIVVISLGSGISQDETGISNEQDYQAW